MSGTPSGCLPKLWRRCRGSERTNILKFICPQSAARRRRPASSVEPWRQRGESGDYRLRAETLADISVAQHQAGNASGAARTLGEAQALVQRLVDAGTREVVLFSIVQAHSHAGNFKAALAFAQRMEMGIWRTWVYARTARHQAEGGDADGAARSLAEALNSVHKIEQDSDVSGIWNDIAVAQSKLHNLPGAARSLAAALAAARKVESVVSRSFSLGHVARARAQVGDIQGALVAAKNLHDPGVRAQTLAEIAEEQAKVGDASGAARSIGRRSRGCA